MHVEAFVLLKPGLRYRVFVRGIVVHNQVQLKMFGRFSIDLLEKLQPLLMPVLALDVIDQTPLKIVQRSEQGDRAMANIIVQLSANMTDAKRYSGQGPEPGFFHRSRAMMVRFAWTAAGTVTAASLQS